MKEKIRQLIISHGADVCGIANIKRFIESPKGFSPCDILVNCKTVIVFGISLPKGLMKINPRLIYNHFNSLSVSKADKVSFNSSKALEKEYNCIAVPLPSDSPYEYWDNNKLYGHGLISMKHAAVLSGLGTLGKNSLLINPDYGNLLTIGAILTDLDIKSDKLHDDICIINCSKCIAYCPVSAISNGTVD